MIHTAVHWRAYRYSAGEMLSDVRRGRSGYLHSLALDSPGTLQCFFRSPIVASMLQRKRHVPQGCRAIGEVGPMHPLEDLECLFEVRNGLLVKPARVANESQPVQGYPCTAPRRVFLVEDSQRLQEQWFGFIMPA